MENRPVTLLRGLLFRVLRLGFRLLPLRAATRDRWRRRFLQRHAHWVPGAPRGQMPAAASPRTPETCAHRGAPAIGHVEHRPGPLPDPLPATLVAFYLPQFHPIPENDAWWGEGFTEWTNVTRALPQFEGHVQPRLPGPSGCYDLRDPDVMRRQMQWAREYGIGAFCLYHYWFEGRQLLDAPAAQWLADPSLDLPICLCWANESWTRRWDGRERDILIEQRHDPDDDLAFIAAVAPYLRDPRYLRVEGRPLLLVYRVELLPDAAATAARWRRWCADNGVGEIMLACVHGFERRDPRTIGFDAAVEFPPNLATPPDITARQQLLNADFRGQVLDWRALAREAAARPMPDYTLFPGVNPGWDNTPRRRDRGRVYLHASPRGYGEWLEHTLARRMPSLPPSRRLAFVNAWNEWAEGAVLEPDARLGFAWLEATRRALQSAAGGAPAADPRPCAVVHAWYPELLDEIVAALRASGIDWRVVVTTAHEREAAVRERLAALRLEAELEVFDNRGRDILPFLHVAHRLLDEGVAVVLKLHTKRSVHRADGDAWRRELLERLLAPARARAILDAFAGQPDLGLVAAEGHVLPLDAYWGANRDNVLRLACRLGLPAPRPARDRFVAGSMFWLRPRALGTLLDAHLCPSDFEPEHGQLDGTLAHAVERVMLLCAQDAGYRMADTQGMPGPSPRTAGAGFGYASHDG